MFFWAIFDQAASTWIFFADTYMNCNIFGILHRRTRFKVFNPVFIVLLIPVSVALFKIFDIRATTKMLVGFILTVVSMLIMSLAVFWPGKLPRKPNWFSRTVGPSSPNLPNRSRRRTDQRGEFDVEG